MVKVASLNFGKGGGHLFSGLALWQAFQRTLGKGFSFYLMTNTSLPVPLQEESLEILRFHLEPEKAFGRVKETMLYQYLQHLEPDVIVVDHIWFPVLPLLQDFSALKAIYFRHVKPQWLKTPLLPDGTIRQFDPEEFDLAFTIEPNFLVPGTQGIPPLIGVSTPEVHPPELIRKILKVTPGKKLALAAHNGLPGELDAILEDVDVDREEYELFTLNNLLDETADQLFPLSHYLSGVDLAIGSCGYNFFYETRFYDLHTLYMPIERAFESPLWRFEKNRYYSGPFDGADRMVSQILNNL